jgi:phosphoribosylformylglycinamidine synthase I
MKFGVVTFPGSNCDTDMVYAWETILGQKVETLWHKDHDLKGCDFILLPGGFSYGDYLRSGAIARFSPIMTEVIKHAEKGGFVLGVCNGFQILCESGLLPGALLLNNSQKFICKNVNIAADNNESAPVALLNTKQAYKIPIAHQEGRYFADKETLYNLNENNQVMFRYCEADGEVTAAANPNGSAENIAGVCNKAGNVFGMMPHPERAVDADLSNTDGKRIFESILNSLVTA